MQKKMDELENSRQYNVAEGGMVSDEDGLVSTYLHTYLWVSYNMGQQKQPTPQNRNSDNGI